MPEPNVRNSLDINLDGRFHNQRAGGAFDVKETLEGPHVGVPSGKMIDATSAQGQEFQTKNGFETKVPKLESRFKVVESGGTQGVSEYGLPNGSDVAGRVIDASSANGQAFQNPNGFEVKVPMLESRLLMVQSGGQAGVSRFVRGLDSRRYGNAIPFHQT